MATVKGALEREHDGGRRRAGHREPPRPVPGVVVYASPTHRRFHRDHLRDHPPRVDLPARGDRVRRPGSDRHEPAGRLGVRLRGHGGPRRRRIQAGHLRVHLRRDAHRRPPPHRVVRAQSRRAQGAPHAPLRVRRRGLTEPPHALGRHVLPGRRRTPRIGVRGQPGGTLHLRLG